MNKYVTESGKDAYKNAIEKFANGRFYTGDISKMSSSIMDEIKKTRTSLMQTSEKKYTVDHPEIVFLVMLICIFIVVVLEKCIKI